MHKVGVGQRGKFAEKKVQEFLAKMSAEVALFDWERIYDARSSMGRIGKQPGDFRFFHPRGHGLIEVKEVAHDFRLPAKNLTQIPGLYKRALAGGLIVVLVYHTTTKLWRQVAFAWLKEHEGQPSWDLSEFTARSSLAETHLKALLTL